MPSALSGLVVVDLSRSAWAGITAALLGDFGADVVRVEELPRPDAPPLRAPFDWEGELAHRNKRSVALALGTPEGRELLLGLLRRADVLVVDQTPDALVAAGLAPEALARLNPGLVYARGTGFGPEGPDRELPVSDELAAARTGVMPILPQPGMPPVYAGPGPMYTAVLLAVGIVCALHHRAESGEGQLVDTSLLAGNLYGASLDLQAFLAIRGERLCRPLGRLDGGNPMSGTLYRTSDDRWVALTMPDTDRWWPAFAPLVGLAADDPRFDSHEKRCETNRRELMTTLDAEFRKRSAAHWRDAFERHQLSADAIERYDFPAGDEGARRDGYVLELERPGLGRVRTLGFPILLSESPARLDRTAPCVGQHTGELLREWLGVSRERIDALREAGVLR